MGYHFCSLLAGIPGYFPPGLNFPLYFQTFESHILSSRFKIIIFLHQELIFLSVFHFSPSNVLLDAFMRLQEICLPLQYPFNKKLTGIHQEYLVTLGEREFD